MIRVLLADDHPFVRTGIRNLLQKTTDIVVVGEAGDGLHTLELAEQLQPDVLVLDMEMPGIKGYEVARTLNTRKIHPMVLVLSAHEDREYILSMLAEGVNGYLTKDEAPDAIIGAVRSVARGERAWVSNRVAARIGGWLRMERGMGNRLQERQVTALRLMVSGKPDDEIARELGMTVRETCALIDDAIQQVRKDLRSLH